MSRYSMVIITRDRRRELLHTLDRPAKLPENPEIFVVDNGSRDGTAVVTGRQREPCGLRE